MRLTPSMSPHAPRRRGGWMLLVPAASAAAGLLFATSARASHGADLRGGERTDLTGLIRAQQHRVALQARSVERLRRDVDRLSRAAAARDSRVRAVLTADSGAQAAAQLTPVSGPSLTVVLDDAPTGGTTGLPKGISADDLVVHQQDVQAVVNALWAGGAHAMRLMDQRVVATSAVRCVGNVLLLQGRTYPPPYRVTALGDPRRMRAALDAAPAVAAYRYYVHSVGLGWETHEERRTSLPAYAGPVVLTHARAARGLA